MVTDGRAGFLLRLPSEIRVEIFRWCFLGDPSTRLVEALRPIRILYQEAWRVLCEFGRWDLNKILGQESLARNPAFLRAVQHVRVTEW